MRMLHVHFDEGPWLAQFIAPHDRTRPNFSSRTLPRAGFNQSFGRSATAEFGTIDHDSQATAV